jgi:hypothetical protein
VDGCFVVLTGCFHAYATGTESKNERRLGPFSSEASAQSACTAIVSAIRLPRIPQQVTERELRAEPTRFNDAHIEVVGTWTYGFERSSFVGGWLTPAAEEPIPRPSITRRIMARGFWSAGDSGGYGHMNRYEAHLCAYEVIDVAGKTFNIAGNDISFEQNGDRDDWRICVDGTPVTMASDGAVAAWLPLGPCLRAPEAFVVRGRQATCLWSQGNVDIQGTVVYMMEEVTIALSADRKTAVVTRRDASDLSA